MEYLQILFQIEIHNSLLKCELSPPIGYHPQSNGQTERANQDLGAALRCVTASSLISWSTHLPWIDYAHNSLTCSTTGLTPFEASLGYLPPLFPALESEIAVPSVQMHLNHCCRIWKQILTALARTPDTNKRLADRHRIAIGPLYQLMPQVIKFGWLLRISL